MICHLNLAKGYRGGERQTELLVRALAGLGIEQSVVLRQGSPLSTRLSDMSGIRIIEITRPFFTRLSALPKLALLHAHEAQASQLAFLAHRFRGHQYIITRRIPTTPKNNPFSHGVYGSARMIVVLSQVIKMTMERYAPLTPLQLIPDMAARFAVDSDKVAKIRGAFGGRFIVGQVGALVMRHKGQQHLIEAARMLREQAPNMVFLLIGSGEDEAALRQLSAGMSNVRFLGYREDIADYLASLDVLVYPSLQEGFGSTLLDAMDLGVPLIVSRVGGIPEVVRDRYNGLLAAPGDSQALASLLLEVYHDAALRTQLVANGKGSVRAYYPDAIAPRYAELYRRL
jgi:glycosyltransferase involved in cell wall biosynthesis